MNRIRSAVTAAAVGGLAMVVAGCGTSANIAAHTTATTRPGANSGGGTTGTQLTATTWLKTVEADVAAAKSVHISGETGGKQFDLTLVKGQGGDGTMTVKGVQAHVVSVKGTLYMQITPSLIAHSSSHLSAAQKQQLTGKYVNVPNTSSDYQQMVQFVTYETFLGGLLEGPSSDRFTVGGHATIDGLECDAFNDTTGGTAYVSVSGTPYLIRVADGSQGTIDLTGWNQQPDVAAPAKSEIAKLPSGFTL